jgi:hypothetical protein
MNAAVLTLDGLRAEFDGPTFQRARALADGRFVKRVEYGADGFIHAQVASSTGYGVYEQRIELIDDGDVVVEGECSCPMEVNCKHVAAALFVLRRRVGPPWPTAAALATDEPATKSAATRKPRPARASEEAEFWLAGLERSAPPRPDAAPAPPTKRLPFALRVVAPGRPVLQMYTAALRTDGQWGKVDPYRRSAREIVYNPPRHVDDAEMELLLRLTTLPADVHGMYLYGRSAVPMLRAVADNGRLWRDPPAAEQPPAPAPAVGRRPRRHAGELRRPDVLARRRRGRHGRSRSTRAAGAQAVQRPAAVRGGRGRAGAAPGRARRALVDAAAQARRRAARGDSRRGADTAAASLRGAPRGQGQGAVDAGRARGLPSTTAACGSIRRLPPAGRPPC